MRGKGSLRSVLVGITLVSICAPAAWALDLRLDQGSDSLQRLKQAYDAVQGDLRIQSVLKKDGLQNLMITQRITGDEVETTKFQHYVRGIEVIGSRAFYHQGQAGLQIRDNLAKFDLDLEPAVGLDAAAGIARSLVGDRALDSLPMIKILPNQDEDSARLVYWVGIEPTSFEGGRDVLIDAHSGAVIADMSRDIEIAPVDVYTTLPVAPAASKANRNRNTLPFTTKGSVIQAQCQRVDFASGYPTAINLSACAKVVSNGKVLAGADAAAKRAASNSTAVLNYYLNNHKRNGFDDRGSPVVSIVHIGSKFANAFWSTDKKIMAYGDGDGEQFADFTRAVDVAGHEMTHGVISETARLLNMGESGALGEAYSDFFAKMISNDRDEWVMGKTIFIDPNAKGIRNLKDPGQITLQKRDASGKVVTLKYPSKMSEAFKVTGSCDRSNDNCWVHVNATIPGHGGYLVAQAIGKQQAAKLYYLTMTQYLHESSTLKSSGTATLDACKQLYDGVTCGKVKTALQSIGL